MNGLVAARLPARLGRALAWTALLSVATTVAGPACQPVPESDSAAEAIVNRCQSPLDCPVNSVCDTGGVCTLCNPDVTTCGASLAPNNVVYIVSFPSLSGIAPGLTVPVRQKELRHCSCGSDVCTCLATVDGFNASSEYWAPTVSGTYRVPRAVQQGVSLDLGNDATVPVRATYTPFSPFVAVDGSGQFDPKNTKYAAQVDVPLETIAVDAQFADASRVPGFSGPRGSAPMGYGGSVPKGNYLRVIEPLAPFDAVFPPVAGPQAVPSGNDDGVLVNAIETKPMTIETSQDLSGWDVFLRDADLAGVRVSNLIHLTTRPSGVGYEIQLRTFGYTSFSSEAVVLEVRPPPDATGLPSIVKDARTLVRNSKISLPSLRSTVHVGGVVVASPEGTPLPATITFQSAKDPTTQTSLLEPVNNDLTYTTQVVTDADGGYSVDLPPGTYDVAIVPNIETGFAANQTTMVVRTGASGEGRGLSAVRLSTLQGIVRIAGARTSTALVDAPLAGAGVRVVPTVSLADVSSTPFRSLLRSRETITGADGSFLLGLDPGVYNLIITPPSGSRYPVSTYTNVSIPASTNVSTSASTSVPAVRLPAISIGSPLDLGLKLYDSADSVDMASTIVRPFVLPSAQTATSAPPFEIGNGLTDSSGRVDLYAAMPVAAPAPLPSP